MHIVNTYIFGQRLLPVPIYNIHLYITCSSLINVYHIMLYRVRFVMNGIQITTFVVIDTECIGSCNFNHHTNSTTTDPKTCTT